MNFAFRLLTFNATSLLVIIFWVQKGHTLREFFPQCQDIAALPNAISCAVYLLVPILLTGDIEQVLRYADGSCYEFATLD